MGLVGELENLFLLRRDAIASMERAILSKKVTYDFARLMEGATQVSCSGFGQVMIDHMS